MFLLQRFANLRLNLKLNLILLVSFGAFGIALVIVTNANFAPFLLEVGQQGLEEEVRLLEQRFAEIEEEIINAARLLGAAPGLSAAVSAGDTNEVRTAILLQAGSLKLDHVDVLSANHDHLLSLSNTSSTVHLDGEDQLFSLGLIGAMTTGLIRDESSPDQVFLAGVVPLKDGAGAVIGAVLVGRRLDASFMDALDFSQPNTHIALIYKGALAAADLSKPQEFDDIPDEQAYIAQAEAGQVFILEHMVEDEDNSPDAIAYMPVRVGGKIQAVFSIRRELNTLYAFRDRMVTAMLAVIGGLSLLPLGIVVVFIQRNITRPIFELKTIAEKVAKGDLKQRAQIHSQDEIGQLARSFNSMTNELEQLMAQLEQRITETQAARDEAERANHVKSAFLASMSHELRTPLNSVINFSKFVVKGVMGPVNERQEEALNKVINSARHLLQLINDVLDMSKIESGSLNLFVENDVNLNDILQTVASTAEGMLSEKSVALELEVPDSLPCIVGDKKRILQVMLNVVSNACKFTEQGHIKIKAAQQNGHINLMVEDTGPGIAPEDYESVFQPFKQTETGLRQGSGTGLGMPISKSLAEAHGGRLWFESVVGQGSTFYVTLPVKADHLQPVSM